MKSKILNLLFLIACTNLTGQLADWESYEIPSENYIKNSGDAKSFMDDGIKVSNRYIDDPIFPYWSGWILSSGKDVTTEGFFNEHSSITGGGASQSNNYLVTFIGNGSSVIKYTNYPFTNRRFSKLSISNNTYAYLSMLNGDMFAKRFGGESGDDPDFLLLTIKGFEFGEETSDSINYYLADYRSDNNSEDYIVDTWEVIDVSAFADADSLSLSLSSSDNGAFGMNTPGYLCVDNIETQIVSNISQTNPLDFSIKSLTSHNLNILSPLSAPFSIIKSNGEVINKFTLYTGINTIDISPLSSGIYILTSQIDNRILSKRFIKI